MVIYFLLPHLTNIKTMRKSKFILAVLAAVAVSGTAKAVTPTYAPTVDPTTGDLSVTFEGDYSDFSMYPSSGTGKTHDDLLGHVGGAEIKTTVEGGTIINVEGADTKIGWLVGQGLQSSVVKGGSKIVVKAGTIDTLVGGIYNVGSARSINFNGTGTGGNVTSGGTSVYWFPYKNDKDITIEIQGGSVGQIYGGHNTLNSSAIKAEVKYYEDKNPGLTWQEAVKDAPWAVGGNINISISGGTVGGTYKDGVLQDAIRGAGGSRSSVDGSVNIEISGGTITGDIYAGARNVGGYVGGTTVNITGGTINGDVYAGGSYDAADGYQSTVKGATKMELSGGYIDGNVYAGGMNDIVQEGTEITMLGDTVEVTGTINGGCDNSGSDTKLGSVGGDKVINMGDDSVGYKGTVKLADFTQVNAVNGEVTIKSLTRAAEGTSVNVAEAGSIKTKAGVLTNLDELNVDGTLNIDMNGADATKDAVSGKVLTMGDNAVINVMLDGAEAANSIALFGFDDTPDDAGEITITLNGKKVDSSLWSFTGGNLVILEATTTTLNLSRNQSRFYNAARAAAAADPDNLALIELTTARDEAAVKAGIDAMSGHEYATAMSSQIEGNLGHLRRLHGAMGKGEMLGKVTDAKMGTTTVSPWRAGVSVFHEETEIDSDARGDGYDRSETGAMLNVEYLTRKDVTLGGAISYGRTNLRTDGAARRHEDNTRFDVYALYGQKRWSFATSLGLGMHEHELLGGDVDGYSINFLQDAAYTVLSNEKSNVQVFGTVESSWNDIDGCSDGVVSAGSQDAWATDVTAGVRYNRALRAFGNAPAGVFTAQTGVTASIGDIKSGVDMNLGGYGYRQESATRNRWGWNIGAGVDVPVRTNVSVYGTAEAVLRGDSNSVDGQIGVKVSF